MKDKAKEGTLKATTNGSAPAAEAPKKRKRWDQQVEDTPSKKIAPSWEESATPAQGRWDETPGRAKGSETPGEIHRLCYTHDLCL